MPSISYCSSRSLNIEKRQRDQAQHEFEYHRLQRQVSHVRSSYPMHEYKQDFDKAQDVKKRMSKFANN